MYQKTLHTALTQVGGSLTVKAFVSLSFSSVALIESVSRKILVSGEQSKSIDLSLLTLVNDAAFEVENQCVVFSCDGEGGVSFVVRCNLLNYPPICFCSNPIALADIVSPTYRKHLKERRITNSSSGLITSLLGGQHG